MDGRFDGNSPVVDLEVISPISPVVRKTYTFTIDTGFTNDLCLTYQEAFPLALTLVGIEEYVIANGSKVNFFECIGSILFEKKAVFCTVSIRPNGSRLMGVSLMKKLGIRLEADFVNQTVKLVRIPMKSSHYKKGGGLP